MDENPKLHSEIASLVLEKLNVEVSSCHEELIESGLLDSLKIVNLLVELELRFGMKISLKELEIDIFRSVASIADFVMNHKRVETVPAAPISESRSQDMRPFAVE